MSDPDKLHRLRSALARVRAEAELLELDGADARGLLEGLSAAFAVLESLEGLECGEGRPPSSVAVVLEDEERLGALTVRALCRLGVPAVLALAAGPALELAEAGATLVADLSALTLGGAEVDHAAVRAAQPIVVSGAASAEARARADELGARAYFLKPVEMEELVAAIRLRPPAAGS